MMYLARVFVSVMAFTGASALLSTPEAAAQSKPKPLVSVKERSFKAVTREGLKEMKLDKRRWVRANVKQPGGKTVHGAPELDPAGAAAVGMILIGAGVILFERRRRTA